MSNNVIKMAYSTHIRFTAYATHTRVRPTMTTAIYLKFSVSCLNCPSVAWCSCSSARY